jgi:hypothetical protein
MKARSRSEGVASGAEAPFRLSADGGAEAPPFQTVELQRLKPPDFAAVLSWLKPRPTKIVETSDTL